MLVDDFIAIAPVTVSAVQSADQPGNVTGMVSAVDPALLANGPDNADSALTARKLPTHMIIGTKEQNDESANHDLKIMVRVLPRLVRYYPSTRYGFWSRGIF